MFMKLKNEPSPQSRAGSPILPRRQQGCPKSALSLLDRVDSMAQFRRRHVLKVMLVVSGQARSDGLELAVRRWGHDVNAVDDASTALEIARESQPDVALLEIEAPLFEGCHLAGLLRNALKRPDCLIIAVTRQADRECRRQCREADMDVVLSMPVNPAVLETLLWMESNRVNRLLADMDRPPSPARWGASASLSSAKRKTAPCHTATSTRNVAARLLVAPFERK